MAQAGGQASERVDVGSKALVDADSTSLRFLEGELEGAEEAGRSRYGHRDKSQLSEIAFPLLVADSFGGSQVREDDSESFLTMRGKLDGLSDCVDDPAQD